VKIHKLWAENVRGISDRVTLELEPTGLNLVTAPNEMGKTTLAEVLNYLFQHKATSKSQEIKELKPYGKDVGPLMGAVIDVDGQIYKIEKQWLKDTKTEVELVSPKKESLAGNAADKAIEKIFTECLDETIWKMIQVAQADFASAISDDYEEDQRDMLRYYLNRAVADEGDDNDESLFEKAYAEYLKWWTPNGKLAGGANTRGREISEKTEEVRNLKSQVMDLEEKIADAATVEEAIVVNRESRDVLQKRKQAQDSNKELSVATKELKVRTDLIAEIDALLATTPAIKGFSTENFEKLSDDRAISAQYTALSSLKLTALNAITLEINGDSVSLKKGEIKDQKLESSLNITIPDLLSIDYQDNQDTTAAGLEEGHNRYLANLKKLDCADYAEAQVLNRLYADYQRKSQTLDTLLGTYAVELLQGSIDKCGAIKVSLSNWDADIEAQTVSVADLEEVAQQVGQKEGRAEEISRFGWHTTLEETREKIKDHGKRLERLNREAQASRMLREVLENHKSSAEKDYSIHFAKYINDIAKSFYGDDVYFEVSDSFEILSRRLGATQVNVGDLSTWRSIPCNSR
jgi:energy-coupling factor transporter ATP-binding protein EcfA2